MTHIKRQIYRISLLCCLYAGNTIYSIEYAKKGTIEISGQASASYTTAPNSRLTTSYASIGLQPTLSYFILDNWFVGTGIQSNFIYGSNSAWYYYGELSVLGGRTFELKPEIFLYGQFEVGSSMPYVQDNGSLQSRYYFFRPTVGVKILVNSVVINMGLRYTLTQQKYSFDPDYYASHNLQLSVGIGFCF